MSESRGEPRGEGRVRRPADLLLSLLAALALGAIYGSVHVLPVGSNELSGNVSRGLLHIPRWLGFGAAVIASLGCIVLVLAVLGVLLRREARGALNAAVAAALAAAIASILAAVVWPAERGSVSHVVLHGSAAWALVLDAAFVAFLTASDIVRRPRWTRWCILAGAVLLLAHLAVRVLAPLALPAVLLGGLLCGWLVRWALGVTPLGPTVAEVGAWLVAGGLDVVDLEPVQGSGGARLLGSTPAGSAIDVRMVNRDTRGSGIARRLWSSARLRPMVAGHPPLTSRAELERLALVSYVAGQAQVVSPAVLRIGELADETLVLATSRPEGCTFDDRADVEATVSLFLALRHLHNAGVAHRDLRGENLIVGSDGAGFASLDAALPGAGELVRRVDLTQLLTTAAGHVGAANAVKAMRDGYRPANETEIVSILQPIALAPWGWSAMREARGHLAEVRREMLGGRAPTPPARLERFRWRTVLSTIALTIAAFLLVGEISRVDLVGVLGAANYGWFAVAVVGSVATYFGAAGNLAAFVPKKLSALRGFFVQLASAFVGLAMPPTVGHVAVNSRYLQKQGIEEGSIAAAVALSQVVNVLTTVVLLLIVGLLTGSGVSRFKIVPSTNVLIALGAIAALLGALMLVPHVRSVITRRVWPRLQQVWPRLLEAASQPVRLAIGAGCNLLLTVGYVVALIASVRAVGGHPALLPITAVYLAGNAVGSAAPTPGGLGAVEAALSAGLTAIGIPAGQAIGAVLIFRVATFWLPIPAGWISFVVLQRREVL